MFLFLFGLVGIEQASLALSKHGILAGIGERKISTAIVGAIRDALGHDVKEKDFEQIGEFLHRGLELTLEIQKKSGKKLVDFVKGLEGEYAPKIKALRDEVALQDGGAPHGGHAKLGLWHDLGLPLHALFWSLLCSKHRK